jgi:glycosyltransferase involved in cell wall biosynthesis
VLVPAEVGSLRVGQNDRSFIVVACVNACNAEKSIAKTVLQLQKYVDGVIVCDDGSSDTTAEIAEGLGALVLRHEVQLGYGSSMATLFSAVLKMDADIAMTVSEDFDYDSFEISDFLEPLKTGDADLVMESQIAPLNSLSQIHGEAVEFGVSAALAKRHGLSMAYDSRAIRSMQSVDAESGNAVEVLGKARAAGLVLKGVVVRRNLQREYSENHSLSGFVGFLERMKELSHKRPLSLYGFPGLISLLLGLGFWIWTLRVFADTRALVTNLALMAIGTTMVGLMLMMTAVILWVTVTVIRERG